MLTSSRVFRKRASNNLMIYFSDYAMVVSYFHRLSVLIAFLHANTLCVLDMRYLEYLIKYNIPTNRKSFYYNVFE